VCRDEEATHGNCNEEYDYYRRAFSLYATGQERSLHEGLSTAIPDRYERLDPGLAGRLVEGPEFFDSAYANATPREAADALRILANKIAARPGATKGGGGTADAFYRVLGDLQSVQNDRFQSNFQASQDAECDQSFGCRADRFIGEEIAPHTGTVVKATVSCAAGAGTAELAAHTNVGANIFMATPQGRAGGLLLGCGAGIIDAVSGSNIVDAVSQATP